jgi:hypothetical protein
LSSLSFRVGLPGRFYELNVHFGVFVGGMGDFSEIFLGNQETFRGCIEDVTFNGIDVLEQARRVSSGLYCILTRLRQVAIHIMHD